jgi:dCMP deaminase
MLTLKETRYNELYMDIANRVSKMSYAKRLHVGALIVKDGNIISMGWNGQPAGFDNICEELNADGSLTTLPTVMHAEFNSIRKIARSTESAENATMYCTHAACLQCALLIYGSGISTFIYGQDYRDSSGLDFLRRAGVTVLKHKEAYTLASVDWRNAYNEPTRMHMLEDHFYDNSED